MKKKVAVISAVITLATLGYKLLSAREDTATSGINTEIALSNKRRTQFEENIAKCKESVQLLETKVHALSERIQSLKTKDNESKLELTKCGDDQRNCEKKLAKCEYTLSQAQDGKCRSYEEAEAKIHEDYDILKETASLSDNCEQSIRDYNEHIKALEATLKELLESKDHETILECKNNLEKCKTGLHTCDLDLINAGCSH